MSAPRLRLLQMLCTPQLVLDNGETLTPVGTDAVHITAADWPDYATTGWVGHLAALQAQADAQQPTPSAPPTPGSREDNYGYPDGVLPCSTVHPGQDVDHPEGHPKP